MHSRRRDLNPVARGRARRAALRLARALLVVSILAFDAHGDLTGDFVGADSCRTCHDDVYTRWSGSHHARAMSVPTPGSVLGDFADARFVEEGIETTFHRKGSSYYVRTQGPDGNTADYEVKYTFGFDPLQQYLLELPGGRLQALTIAWDARSKSEGGQRWFSLYPDETLTPGDPLHWTGYLQNWSLQCAHCHSTDLRKRYDAESATYDTRYAEINVACEACHGAGKRHAEWAKTAEPPYPAGDPKGLDTSLTKRTASAWRFLDEAAAVATRTAPGDENVVATCAPCHARRAIMKESAPPDANVYDAYRPALLTEPLYFVDGQQHDEVYTWGSFLQSKMYQRGVVCSDCHDSHTLALRAEGNALCAQCHRPGVFDTPDHHHHAAGSNGARCVECHMPARTYMVVDPRRDHAFKVPRPDVAAEIGAPDACTQCHTGKTQTWAAEAMDGFYGDRWRTRPQIATRIHTALRRGTVGARTLLQIANDGVQPAIVRATAVASAGAGFVAPQVSLAVPLLRDEDPGVRLAALDLVARLPPDARISLAAPLLTDRVLGVRLQAAVVLAGAAAERLSPEQVAARARGIDEYVAAQMLNADQPFANVNLGNLHAQLGRSHDARSAFERAVRIDPRHVPAYANLADLERALGDEEACDAVLARGLSAVPDAASLLHARGLSRVRRGASAEALTDLEAAARLDPTSPRYAYVYGVALHSAGRTSEAFDVLAAADRAHPYDVDILGALASLLAEARNPSEALVYARKLDEAVPGDPNVANLLTHLLAALGAGDPGPE
jgi:predicted CXXCH cytochrome family protein